MSHTPCILHGWDLGGAILPLFFTTNTPFWLKRLFTLEKPPVLPLLFVNMRDVSPDISEKIKKETNSYMDKIKGIMPEALASALDLIDPRYFDESETTLRTLLQPTAQQEAIRSRLWSLINERQRLAAPPRIQLSEIASGIASIKFILGCFETPLMVAWCAVPTMDYDTRVEAMLDKAYAKMKEILDLPIKNDLGMIDAKAANLVLQVAKMIDLRSKGNYVERVEQKTLQVNASAKEAQAILGLPPDASIEQIEEKIRLLEGSKEVIDVG